MKLEDRAREFREQYVREEFDDWMSVEGHTEEEFDDKMLSAFAREERERCRNAQCRHCEIGTPFVGAGYPDHHILSGNRYECSAAAIRSLEELP